MAARITFSKANPRPMGMTPNTLSRPRAGPLTALAVVSENPVLSKAAAKFGEDRPWSRM